MSSVAGAKRKVVAIDDDDEDTLYDVQLGSVVTRTLVDPEDDAFAREAEVLKSYEGVSTSVRRKTTRELKKVHAGTGGAASKKIEEPNVHLTGYHLFDVMQPPYNLDYLARLNEISPPHYAAVKAKVANIVGLGYDFIESHKTRQTLEQIDDEDKVVKVRRKIEKAKSDMYDWLDSCNQDDEFLETLIKVWTDYETTGNGYLEIGRKTTGEIGYLGHVPATLMRIRRLRDGFVQITGNKSVFFRNFGDQDTPNPIGGDNRPNEIIHIKKYSPTNNFYGVPDIVAAQSAIAGAEFASRFNLDYFENKAVPRYVITVKGGSLSPKAERNILEFFQTNIKGKNHRTLYVPMPADTTDKKHEFKMTPVEAGTQDSSFNNYDKGNLNKVLMAHRVPISKVGMAEGVSLAVARDADKTFKEQVCRPEQSIFEKKLNKIFKEVTDVFILKLNELTLTDEDTMSKIEERYLRWGVLVPNEVRLAHGRTGLKDGDKPVSVMAQAELQAKVATDNAKLSAKTTAASASASQNNSTAQMAATANGTRTRVADRSAASSDSAGEARQPKGSGKATA
jgi:PBSX family phage portal protein